jgi:hypothetical protein
MAPEPSDPKIKYIWATTHVADHCAHDYMLLSEEAQLFPFILIFKY